MLRYCLIFAIIFCSTTTYTQQQKPGLHLFYNSKQLPLTGLDLRLSARASVEIRVPQAHYFYVFQHQSQVVIPLLAYWLTPQAKTTNYVIFMKHFQTDTAWFCYLAKKPLTNKDIATISLKLSSPKLIDKTPNSQPFAHYSSRKIYTNNLVKWELYAIDTLKTTDAMVKNRLIQIEIFHIPFGVEIFMKSHLTGHIYKFQPTSDKIQTKDRLQIKAEIYAPTYLSIFLRDKQRIKRLFPSQKFKANTILVIPSQGWFSLKASDTHIYLCCFFSGQPLDSELLHKWLQDSSIEVMKRYQQQRGYKLVALPQKPPASLCIIDFKIE